jgi:hypothetical protein
MYLNFFRRLHYFLINKTLKIYNSFFERKTFGGKRTKNTVMYMFNKKKRKTTIIDCPVTKVNSNDNLQQETKTIKFFMQTFCLAVSFCGVGPL